jgi:hypothetical protein
MKKGALEQTVKRKYGAAGFTTGGKIKTSVLNSLKKGGSAITRKRANFALNIRKRRSK